MHLNDGVMAKGTIIAYHGWGFDSSCWDVWKQYLEPDFKLLLFEKGYFSDTQKAPSFPSESSLNIIFAHSFGLHQCPAEIYNQADLLFIFSGFRQFHPVAAQFQRRSRLVLKQMIDQFGENPGHVLKEFYANVYSPESPIPLPDDSLNEALLLEDLKKLGNSEIELQKLKSVHKIGILHGFNDRIVPRAKGRELFSNLRSQGKYFEIKECGHALPFTHHEQCWSLIEPEIEQYLKHE
ncbi:MAG: alpha/beta hydrolase [Balneolaceae bacterium]|nr:alpha/beta hydrolase [Balneolaceae bacterium]